MTHYCPDEVPARVERILLEKQANPSWSDIHSRCKQIASFVKNHLPIQPKIIIGIARGGLIPAVIISHYLNISGVIAAYYSSHAGEGDKKQPNILPQVTVDNYPLLIVDDIEGSGNTLKEVTEHYKNGLPQDVDTCRVYSAVLVRKHLPNAKHVSDFWAGNAQDVWVTFPWEK